MNNMQAFFAQNAEITTNIKEVISTRFKDSKGKPIPFEFRAISSEEDKNIKKSCMKKVKVKKGVYQDELDIDSYTSKFLAASIVFPELKNAELQKSYGVMGEVDLLRAMLLPGEFTEASLIAQSINGYDKDMNDLVEEAKN